MPIFYGKVRAARSAERLRKLIILSPAGQPDYLDEEKPGKSKVSGDIETLEESESPPKIKREETIDQTALEIFGGFERTKALLKATFQKFDGAEPHRVMYLVDFD